MSVIKGSALVLAVVLAGGLATASSPEPGSGATSMPSVRLKTISARVTNKGTSLVIEATEPVPYVATRPDALTLLIDFRNVAADTVTSTIAADVRSAIASVVIEQVPDEATGSESPRIRVMLSEPVAHRARASRNTVVIDFEKLDKSAKARGNTPYVLPPATRAPTPGAAMPEALLARVDSTAVDPIAAC